MATSKAALSLATLSPTSSATHQHALRTYYQVQAWLGNSLNPCDWGWAKTTTMYIPIRTTDILAPASVLKLIHCSCQSNCGKACGCRKAGLLCTNICKNCKGDTCSNCETVIVAEENEDDINNFNIDEEITVDETGDNNDNTEDEDSENEYDRPIVIPEYIKRVQSMYNIRYDSEEEEEQAANEGNDFAERKDNDTEAESSEQISNSDESQTSEPLAKKLKTKQ